MLTHARSHLRACASAEHRPRMMWPSPYPAAELAGAPPRTSLPVAPAKGALDIPLADAAAPRRAIAQLFIASSRQALHIAGQPKLPPTLSPSSPRTPPILTPVRQRFCRPRLRPPPSSPPPLPIPRRALPHLSLATQAVCVREGERERARQARRSYS